MCCWLATMLMLSRTGRLSRRRRASCLLVLLVLLVFTYRYAYLATASALASRVQVTGFSCLRPDYCTCACRGNQEARRTTVLESKFKHARVGATQTLVRGICSRLRLMFIRATLVVGLMLATSSESADLPKCRACRPDVACWLSFRVERKRWRGPTTTSWLHR